MFTGNQLSPSSSDSPSPLQQVQLLPINVLSDADTAVIKLPEAGPISRQMHQRSRDIFSAALMRVNQITFIVLLKHKLVNVLVEDLHKRRIPLYQFYTRAFRVGMSLSRRPCSFQILFMEPVLSVKVNGRVMYYL